MDDGNELHRACEAGDIQAVRALLNSGASVNAKAVHASGITPLHVASSLEVVKELLDRQADLEMTTSSGDTPLLHFCRYCDRLDVVRELLDRGANIDAVNISGKTALEKAASNNFCDIVDLLLSRGASVNIGCSVLHAMAWNEDCSLSILDSLLDRGADINARDEQGETPLTIAILFDNYALARALIARGASVDVAGESGWTPLHLAGEMATVCALLDAGADINSRTNDGETVLEMACSRLDRELAELFLSRDASFPDVEHLIDKAKSGSGSEQDEDAEEFVKFLEDYVAAMHPVMK